MKISLLRGTVINGEAKSAGDIVEADDLLASFLMSTGKGIPADEAKKSDRSVGLKTSTATKVKKGSK